MWDINAIREVCDAYFNENVPENIKFYATHAVWSFDSDRAEYPPGWTQDQVTFNKIKFVIRGQNLQCQYFLGEIFKHTHLIGAQVRNSEYYNSLSELDKFVYILQRYSTVDQRLDSLNARAGRVEEILQESGVIDSRLIDITQRISAL